MSSKRAVPSRARGRSIVRVLLPTLLLCSCDGSDDRDLPSRIEAAPSDCYAFMSGSGPQNEAEYKEAWDALPYSRIEFDRFSRDVWSSDSRGHYSVVLERGGRANASGTLPTGAKGNFEGSGWLYDYARLCQIIDMLHIQDLKRDYDAKAFHADDVIVRVFRGDGRSPIEIHEYSSAGPVSLWALHQCIDGVVARVRWQPSDTMTVVLPLQPK